MTQGSRVAATLGIEPESRWDSRMTRGGVKGVSYSNLCIQFSNAWISSLAFNHTRSGDAPWKVLANPAQSG